MKKNGGLSGKINNAVGPPRKGRANHMDHSRGGGAGLISTHNRLPASQPPLWPFHKGLFFSLKKNLIHNDQQDEPAYKKAGKDEKAVLEYLIIQGLI